jgi:hypothetical protein
VASETGPLDGGCACGAVRYRTTSGPLVVHCRHCRWCQRETGASFALNAVIEADPSKQPWVVLPPGTPAVAEFYQLEDHWPRESLDRLRAMRTARSGG